MSVGNSSNGSWSLVENDFARTPTQQDSTSEVSSDGDQTLSSDESHSWNHAGRESPDSSPPIFQPPYHFLCSHHGTFHKALELGRQMHRPVLVSLQNYEDDHVGSHMVDFEIFQNDLVEDLIDSKFVFWQTTIDDIEARSFAAQFGVKLFPFLGIIHPNHASIIWGKEGWIADNPWDIIEIVQVMTDVCFERYSAEQLDMEIDFEPSQSVKSRFKKVI